MSGFPIRLKHIADIETVPTFWRRESESPYDLIRNAEGVPIDDAVADNAWTAYSIWWFVRLSCCAIIARCSS